MLPIETVGLPEAPVDLLQYQNFVSALTKKRDQAIAGRRSSGIEADWLEDEEYYQSIDDVNRQFVRSWVASIKRGNPISAEPTGNRSTVFLNITRPYVDAAAARLADMLLPVDDECFAILSTPIAEVDARTNDLLKQAGIQWSQLQEQIQQQSDHAAELMQEQISDRLVECHWHGEVRTVIEDAARIGCGVLKGPFPRKEVLRKYSAEKGMETVTEIRPGSMRIDPWNFFPDPACGEDIHDGAYVWERAYVTPKQLRDVATMPGYNAQAVAEVLGEGPKQLTSREAPDGTYIPIDHIYEMWTFYGLVASGDANVAGVNINDDMESIPVMAILVNDRLIKMSQNVMDTGEYPYDVLAWQRRPGVPWGMGIARHIRTPQRMLNAACRAMMDNAGMIAAPQEVVGNGVTPDDGAYEIRGRKLWRGDTEVIDVTKAFYCYTPPSHIEDFQKIIEFSRSIAEQTTGMPMLLQGQQPEGDAGDTLGGMQLLQNNATGVLRRLAKRFDDHLTSPHIRRYYHWEMQYNPRDDIKGDFQVDVRASSALIERDSQKQFMLAAMQFAKDPAYGIDPYKLFNELAKADRMNPKRIQFDEDDYEKRQGQPSALDQSKTALNEAKAAQAQAAAVLAKVEALFSAVNAANLVASNPAIAPAADQTAKSAGFVDADQPPAVGTPEGGAPSVPVPSNTSPAFPPTGNPPAMPSPMPKLPDAGSAATGAGTGVEGG